MHWWMAKHSLCANRSPHQQRWRLNSTTSVVGGAFIKNSLGRKWPKHMRTKIMTERLFESDFPYSSTKICMQPYSISICYVFHFLKAALHGHWECGMWDGRKGAGRWNRILVHWKSPKAAGGLVQGVCRPSGWGLAQETNCTGALAVIRNAHLKEPCSQYIVQCW